MIPLEAHFRLARQNNEIDVMELDENGAVGPSSCSYEFTVFTN